MVWDIGTYELIEGNYYKGYLRLYLNGKKLKGEWTLTRSDSDGKKNWLLVKSDEPAKLISSKRDDSSALTGRSMARKLQRQDARRVPERTLVPDSERSSPDHRSLEKGLQRGSAPQLTGQLDPARVHSARGNSPVAYGSLRAAA